MRFWDRAMANYLQWHKSLRKPKKHVSEPWNESESDIDDPPSIEEIQDLLRQIEAEMQEQEAEIKWLSQSSSTIQKWQLHLQRVAESQKKSREALDQTALLQDGMKTF